MFLIVSYVEAWIENFKDVDKSEVILANCIQSPVFGQIPATRLSDGVKIERRICAMGL